MAAESLNAAVDELYVTFAGEPPPSDIEYCPCCLSREQVVTKLLAPTEPGELPAAVMADYAAYAMTTVGGVAEFRYFLPRVLQIAVLDGFDWPDLELVFGKLRLAAWTTRAAAEQRAVRNVLGALWSQTLGRYPSRPAIDPVLCAIGLAEDDLGPYLDRWSADLATGAAAPAEQLRDLLTWSAKVVDGQWRLTNAHWQRRDNQVVTWLGAAST